MSSSGKRSGGFGDWEKRETTRYDDNVGLGLRLQHHHQQQQLPNHLYSSSSGDGLSRVAFTANQRVELERQTMIYKYMMSSMPVPPELIIPLSKYPSSANLPPLLQHNDQSSSRKGLEMRYNGSGRGMGGAVGDPEPWRCRRTDGKKWRCSRDVAPDQKYCERHSHKGRPSARSRKPVESSLLASSSSASTTTNSTTITTTTTTCNPIVLNPFQHHPSSYDLPASLPHYNQHHSSLRYPEWFMKEEVVPAAHVLYPQQVEQIGLENRGHTSHFSHTSSPSDHTTTRPLPRSFIDAWSLEDIHKVANTTNNPTSTANAASNLTDVPTEVTRSNKRPTSSSVNSILPLTLSMSAGFEPDNNQNNAKEDDHESIREIRSSQQQQQQQQPSNWMSSWINLPSGGPLAEALCLGISGSSNAWANHSDELVSPHGHSSSSTSTTMSSKGSHASGDTAGQGFHFQH